MYSKTQKCGEEDTGGERPSLCREAATVCSGLNIFLVEL